MKLYLVTDLVMGQRDFYVTQNLRLHDNFVAMVFKNTLIWTVHISWVNVYVCVAYMKGHVWEKKLNAKDKLGRAMVMCELRFLNNDVETNINLGI